MFRNPYADGIIVLVILLLFFGPKRLPTLGRSLGTGLREFKTSITGDSGGSADDEQFEIPKAAPAAQQPAPPAPQPAPAYQQPAPGYQQPAPGYQQPAPGYQQPAPGYQQPAPGYQQPAQAPEPQPAPAATPADPAV